MIIGVWGDLFPVLTFVVSAGLAIYARLKGWQPNPLPEDGKKELDSPFKENGSFYTRHRWSILLTAIVAGIFLYSLIFAPPRLTGEIPPTPNQPGRPFYSFHWIRDFTRENSDSLEFYSSLITGLLCFVPLVFSIKNRSRRFTEVSLLFSSLSLAILAQWRLGRDELNWIGVVLYIISMLGIIYWAWLSRDRISTSLSISPANAKLDAILLLGLLGLTAFGRFYALESVPYGIEGDEAKWTSEAVNLTILGQPDSSGEYHRDALPVSYYLETPFYRLFGPSLLSARASAAFLSVLASLFFFWFLRQITSLHVAGLSTYLLAISIFDISASRLANVESFVKLWAILPFALLAMALKKRTWQAFCLVGISLALAALTYDTLWPIIIICFIITLFELRKTTAGEKYQSLAAILAPIFLILPVVIPYFISRINYYELGNKGWDGEWLVTLGKNFSNVLESWFVILRPDFLYNRPGPLINSALLPWLVIGIIASLFSLKKAISSWALLWAGLIILPVPILTNSPLGRVYYPALPAIYVLIAVGMLVFWSEVRQVVAQKYTPILVAILLVPFVWLPLTNYFIYFNEVSDPDDRQMRREISRIAATVTDDETLLLLPVVPNADEPLNNEYQMIELFLMQKLDEKDAKKAYTQLALEDVLPTISNELKGWNKIIVVLDNDAQSGGERRTALREGLDHCYPTSEFIEGYYFDQFIINNSDRKDSPCIPVEVDLEITSLSKFDWRVSRGNVSSLIMLCDRQRTTYLWVEAEELSPGPGWHIEINFAPGWYGNGFLMDTYGSQFLGYEFAPGYTGSDLYVWARTYKRVVDNSPVFINLNGTTETIGNTSDKLLNQWIWEVAGPFPNDEINKITIARPYDENLRNFMAIFLDTFIFTTDESFSPEEKLTDTLEPMRFAVNPKADSGTIDREFDQGQYSCRIQIDSDGSLVDHFGRIPILSNIVTFTVP